MLSGRPVQETILDHKVDLSFQFKYKTPFDYTLNNQILENVNSFCHLGVIINTTLAWKKHIQCEVAKFNRLLRLI